MHFRLVFHAAWKYFNVARQLFYIIPFSYVCAFLLLFREGGEKKNRFCLLQNWKFTCSAAWWIVMGASSFLWSGLSCVHIFFFLHTIKIKDLSIPRLFTIHIVLYKCLSLLCTLVPSHASVLIMNAWQLHLELSRHYMATTCHEFFILLLNRFFS